MLLGSSFLFETLRGAVVWQVPYVVAVPLLEGLLMPKLSNPI